MSEPILTVDHLVKSYDGQTNILDNVSFGVQPGEMIGVVEVLKVTQQIIEANRTASPNAAFGIYLTVFILYFLACWPISLLAGYLEKKWK